MALPVRRGKGGDPQFSSFENVKKTFGFSTKKSFYRNGRKIISSLFYQCLSKQQSPEPVSRMDGNRCKCHNERTGGRVKISIFSREIEQKYNCHNAPGSATCNP